jgi:hypothetical protein
VDEWAEESGPGKFLEVRAGERLGLVDAGETCLSGGIRIAAIVSFVLLKIRRFQAIVSGDAVRSSSSA